LDKVTFQFAVSRQIENIFPWRSLRLESGPQILNLRAGRVVKNFQFIIGFGLLYEYGDQILHMKSWGESRMNKQELINKAAEIRTPSMNTANEFRKASAVIVAELNEIMRSRPDLEKLIGENNLDMMLDNHNNHARFMSALLADFSPAVLVDTVLWVFRAYKAHGFQPTYWPAQLNAWIQLLKKHLSPEALEEIIPIYNFLLTNQPYFDLLSARERDQM
jgi:hypothetical protein